MPSQKSRRASHPVGATPQRTRGIVRVAAILDAATAVFGEKGYDAATMTEVAERSRTAIGSLYRFFPTKNVLAEALLARYLDLSRESLASVAAIAETATPQQLAAAFIKRARTRHPLQSAALAVSDAHKSGERLRLQARTETRESIATLLRAFAPSLGKARSHAASAAVAQVLKGVTRSIDEGTEKYVSELEHMLAIYFADLRH